MPILITTNRSYLVDHYCFLSSNNVYSRNVDVVYDFIHYRKSTIKTQKRKATPKYTIIVVVNSFILCYHANNE